MKLFIQLFIYGLQLGGIYALIALGYTMVYGIVQLINFAHGEIIMFGAYVSLISISYLLSVGSPVWICLLIAVVACAVLGVLCNQIAYKPLRDSPRISVLITAIGASLFLQNIAMLIFSPNPRAYINIMDFGTLELWGIKVDWTSVITISLSLLLMGALQLFVKFTKTGMAMRAVSQDEDAAKLMGVNVNKTIGVTFAIGSALAAVAAVLYGCSYSLIDPYMGSMLGLKAFVAAVLGGIGVIPGAMVGGLILGVAEFMTKGYISTQLADAVVFGILIIVLLVKPSGVLGKSTHEKV